jgi:hypothetical protein
MPKTENRWSESAGHSVFLQRGVPRLTPVRPRPTVVPSTQLPAKGFT